MTLPIDYLIDELWQPGDVRAGAPPDADPGDPHDPDGNPDVDFEPAVRRALADLTASNVPGRPMRPARFHFTGRIAYPSHAPWFLNHPVTIVGACTRHRAGASRLLFHGCGGLVVDYDAAGVGSLRLDGVAVEYVGSSTAGADDHHGILLRRPSDLDAFVVYNFPGHGIHAEGDVSDPALHFANVSMSTIQRGTVFNCGLTGLWIKGRDANNMTVANVNAFANGRKRRPGDGANFYDESVLGNNYRDNHGRNGDIVNYWFRGFLSSAPGSVRRPGMSSITDCYSECGPVAIPAADQPGPDVLEAGTRVTCNATDGSIGSATGGASIEDVAEGMRRFRPGAKFGGPNGSTVTLGDATVRLPGDPTPRGFLMAQSTAYGIAGTDLTRLYGLHDPVAHVWGFRAESFVGPPVAFGVTDRRHARGPGLMALPRGALLGAAGLLVASHDPRYEAEGVGTPPTSAAASLHGKFPLAAAKVGDRVLNELRGPAYPWEGWHCSWEGGAAKSWRRYPVGAEVIGPVVPAGPPPPLPPPP